VVDSFCTRRVLRELEAMKSCDQGRRKGYELSESETGLWRPGDSVFLSIAESENREPGGHNPRLSYIPSRWKIVTGPSSRIPDHSETVPHFFESGG
jgi:hypothetical protein